MSRAKKAVETLVASAEPANEVTEVSALEAPEVVYAPAQEPAQAKTVKYRVIAKDYFVDSFLGRDFRAGQEVVGWDEERIREYAKRGVVVVNTVIGPNEFK